MSAHRLFAFLLLASSLSAPAAREFRDAAEAVSAVNLAGLRSAVEDMSGQFGSSYLIAPEALQTIAALEARTNELAVAVKEKRIEPLLAYLREVQELRHRLLVEQSPAIDFDRILLIRRAESEQLGLPQNWQGNPAIHGRFTNEIATLAIRERDPAITTLYLPDRPIFVGDLDLHYDANRLLFSAVGTNRRWQVFEIGIDGRGLRQVTRGGEPDVDQYDGAYLPDGRIVFCSTANFQGVPCVGGSDPVGNIHIAAADGSGERRLTFDQDHDWCPTVMNDGRVMYLRWEYADLPHYFTRILMRMNPDGIGQAEFYGSGSYWPNGIFFARPIPGSPTKFTGIVSGHHGVPRMGELILFDVSKGRSDANGAIRRIASRDATVEAIVRDGLVQDSWPKFLHPYPLDEKRFLVSAKPSPRASWGLYLVDVFDNMTLLKEEPGQVLFEPIPLRATPRPPVIPDRVRPNETNAVVAIQDIYAGRGLPGVPRGTVKALRVYQYEFGYRNLGGHYVVGIEGPWDIRRILGTVPVQEDGSANFEIPANTPVAVQPLDAEGKALQQFRSWFVGMPGERVSCVGCHESQSAGIAAQMTKAIERAPDPIAPWHGSSRGFDFVREVQPVLDRKCAGCHDGTKAMPNLADITVIPTSRGLNRHPQSYVALHPYVRRNGCEGYFGTLIPLEFHADTSELVRLLRKGHYNVKLDAEEWDRLVTWIDLNVPCYGTWSEAGRLQKGFVERRHELKKSLAGVDQNIEDAPTNAFVRATYVEPAPLPPRPAPVAVPGWPFPADEARKRQEAGGPASKTVDLGDGVKLVLQRIPAGSFEMGDVNGEVDEFPTAKADIAKPFWLGATEVTLAQFRLFRTDHRNGFYDQNNKDQNTQGYGMDTRPDFPVIRVSWEEAAAFCAWLSQKIGLRVTLPTETQWEWACRAGTATPLNYGGLDTDFGSAANLADRTLRRLAVGGVSPSPMESPDPFFDYVPKDARFDDKTLHLASVGHYAPNAWGLHDMHGNVAEWTASDYAPRPGTKVVRGGAWNSRPKNARSSFRDAFPPWQKVYNTGFRVLVEDAM